MTSSFLESVDIPEENELFTKICDIRTSFSLPQLKKNQGLKSVINELLETRQIIPVVKNSNSYVMISIQEIYDSFENENIDQILIRWFQDSHKRSILLNPGNYAAAGIKYNNSDHTSGHIAFVIALIYRKQNLSD